jgi:hydrogenase maturation protease
MRGHGRVLVAGIGNVFFGDDGFGPAVITRIPPDRLPAGVDIGDYGIRGVHLAYDLLDGRHSTLVLVDALPGGEPPGTLEVLEIGPDAAGEDVSIDAHAMGPASVLAALRSLGGSVGRVLVVGCHTASFDQGLALSPRVHAAVDSAVPLVLAVAEREAAALELGTTVEA